MSEVKTVSPAFIATCSYLGWGDPEGGIWLIGLEEASTWDGYSTEQIIDECRGFGAFRRDPECQPSSTWKTGRQVRDCAAKILHAVSRDQQITWRDYRDKRLYVDGYKACQSNLFPLGKPTWNGWPETYSSMFGFSNTDVGRDTYRAAVREYRWPVFRREWDANKPQATICFGKVGWPYVREIFSLKNEGEALADGRFRCTRVSESFSRHSSDEAI